MRIYVAAKGEEYLRARAFMKRWEDLELARGRAMAITYDWTADIERHEAKPFTKEQLRESANADIDAACAADAVVVLYHPRLRGGLVEMGAAIALEVPVVVVGCPPDEQCIFYSLIANVDTEDEAIAKLVEWNTERDA